MTPSTMARPVTFAVDPSMYGSGYATPRDVYGDLDRVVRTDLYYHYATPVCAQRWLDVCEDPEYGHHALLDQVSGIMPDVVEALRADSGGGRVAVCSLGPGDGSVDERIVGGLAAGMEVVSYTGLDFSFELLRRCVHRLVQAPGLPVDLPLHAVCGDFTDPRSVDLRPLPADTFRVFALTGFTFGNYPESRLLRGIETLMSEGDYLFVDARVHGLGRLNGGAPSDTSAIPGTAAYDTGPVRRFVLGPVEVATTAATEELRVSFDVTDSVTDVPNALNLVIYCEGLDATMRFTGERVRRDRLNLAVTTSYHIPDLASWLEGAGFAPVWRRTVGDVAFFLLKR